MSNQEQEPQPEHLDTLGTYTKTSRGFGVIVFADGNGVGCSLQESSAYRESGPMLWLGCNEPSPRVMRQGEGWVSVEMPKDTLYDTRMHLEREQVEALVKLLQGWLEEGRL